MLTLICNVVSNWCTLLTNSDYMVCGLGLRMLGSNLGYILVFEVLKMDYHGYGPNWEYAEQHCVLRNSISFSYQYFPSNIAYSVYVVNSNTYTCVSPLKLA